MSALLDFHPARWVTLQLSYLHEGRSSTILYGGYDVNANYHATPPNIRPGAVLTSVTCSPDGVKLYVNQYLVVEFNWKGGPKAGAVRWDASGALSFRSGLGFFALVIKSPSAHRRCGEQCRRRLLCLNCLQVARQIADSELLVLHV